MCHELEIPYTQRESDYSFLYRFWMILIAPIRTV